MSPIFIILYAVVVTLVLTLVVIPRLREANPQLMRILLVAGIAGLIVLGVLLFV